MRRLIGGLAGRTYYIVGNLMSWLVLLNQSVCTDPEVGMGSGPAQQYQISLEILVRTPLEAIGPLARSNFLDLRRKK